MHPMDQAVRLKKVLTWINSERAWLNMEPLTQMPRGVRGDVYSCPVARSLSNGWEALSGPYSTKLTKETRVLLFFKQQERRVITHPSFIKVFISEFDRGEYPQLEEDVV